MKEKTKDLLKKYFKVLLGLVLIIAGVYGCIYWWAELKDLIKGFIGPFIALIGFLFVFIGFSD